MYSSSVPPNPDHLFFSDSNRQPIQNITPLNSTQTRYGTILTDNCLKTMINDEDRRVSELVISNMQSFLENNCTLSGLDYSQLSVRPLSYKSCLQATYLIEKFNAKIKIGEPSSVQFQTDSKLNIQLCKSPELYISDSEYKSLTRYTEVLVSKRLDALMLKMQQIESAKKSREAQKALLLKKPKVTTPAAKKSCNDGCTLF